MSKSTYITPPIDHERGWQLGEKRSDCKHRVRLGHVRPVPEYVILITIGGDKWKMILIQGLYSHTQ